MNKPALLALSILLSSLAGQAQAERLYRWTDEQGRVHYTDKPPPAQAKDAKETRVFAGRPDTSLPFSVRQAAADFPVTLYTAENCKPCEDAKALLAQRGIPFAEQVIRSEEDFNAFKALFQGNEQVPAATVGARQLAGFERTTWNALLDKAGYPQTPLP